MLVELAAAPGGISLPRLAKRLRLRMSVLMRTLAWMGEAPIGGVAGPGWVRLEGDDDRRIVVPTAAGLAAAGREGGV